MRSVYFYTLGALVLVALCASPALAQAGMPKEIHFQGKLSDSTGNPVSASVTVQFNIYNTASGGAALFTENHTVFPDSRGIYNVRIGSNTAGGIVLPFNEPYYLGVTVGSDAEMSPRYAMVAAPYSMRANVATNIDGLTVTMAELNQLAGITTNVDATNLNTLTAGPTSDATNLHTHTTAGNADTVDSFHANATPTANNLLPLSGTGLFPAAVVTQGVGSTLDADLLDGQQGAFYQDATNINAGILPVTRGGTGAGNAPGALGNLGGASLTAANTFTGANTFALPVASTVTTGTAPLTIASTTLVTNLNADQVDGLHAQPATNPQPGQLVALD
ncbi:MAG: hypothetical protein ACYS47_19340, partial [Planctomycetota bacterium]